MARNNRNFPPQNTHPTTDRKVPHHHTVTGKLRQGSMPDRDKLTMHKPTVAGGSLGKSGMLSRQKARMINRMPRAPKAKLGKRR